jgi:adenylate cyclase
MRKDEAGTLARLKGLIRDVIEPIVGDYDGRIFKTTGDGLLIEFTSAIDAVQAAIDVQQGTVRQSEQQDEEARIKLRIGINLGDVIVDGEDLYGDGVNVATRLEGLAEPGGICVASMVHDGVQHQLDLQFIDLGEQSLKNIPQPIRTYKITVDHAGRGGATTTTDPLFRRPAVAVLPFANLSGDPDQEYLADGLTEDIITALSLWKSFPVIARNSAFAYKGQSPDIRKVGEELGARYVIEGSIRKGGNRVRVTAQLINAETGHHVWAERYDRDLEDIFALQDELTERIAATVAPEIERAVRSGSASGQRAGLDAWDLYQRGMAYQNEFTKGSNERARDMFARAIEVEPTFAKAHAALGFSYLNDNLLGFSKSVDEYKRLGRQCAQRAIELDNSDPTAHFVLSIACAQAAEFSGARRAMQISLDLNPLNSRAICSMGHLLTLSGEPEKALPLLEKGLRLSPLDPSNHMYFSFMARALFSLRRYDEAIDWARRSIQLRSEAQEPYHVLAASLGHLGRSEEGKNALESYMANWPDQSRRSSYFIKYGNSDDQEHLLSGLRKAGWED